MLEKPGIETDIFAQPIVSSVILVEVKLGEGKRRNEFAEWHVAWLAE